MDPLFRAEYSRIFPRDYVSPVIPAHPLLYWTLNFFKKNLLFDFCFDLLRWSVPQIRTKSIKSDNLKSTSMNFSANNISQLTWQ